MLAQRIGKYRIIAKLGQGGMASVFLSVLHQRLGVNKLLATKVLKEELAEDADFQAMFINEARLATRLNHANVVNTYEVGVEGSRPFLVMDYLDGQPLHALLRKGSRAHIPLEVCLRILADMLAGLHYAHTLTDFDGTPLGVVHRDVSPQNVFVTYDGQVKLVDFGIAKAAGGVTTQQGDFKGKLAYVAPEQAAGGTVDARADVFSVGVMLWEAIAGRRFVLGDGQAAMLSRRISGTETTIREVAPDVDPTLADICDRATAHAVEDRFTTAQELRDALEGYLEQHGKHLGQREIGQFASELFAEERERMRAMIDEQMRRIALEEEAEPTPPTTVYGFAESERFSIVSAPGHAEGDAGATPSQDALISRSPTGSIAGPITGRAAVLALIGLAALALALIGALVAVLMVRSPHSPSVATTAALAPASASASASAPASTPAAEAAQITLSITFGPAGAIAKLDGAPLAGSPFVARVPRDGSLHRIDFSGPGFERETRLVSYEQDVAVAVSLKPVVLAPRANASAAPAPGRGIDRTAPYPTGPQAPRPPDRPAREIDKENPYKR